MRADERGLARAVKRVLPGDDTSELLLVIDQFEELFTLVADERVRADFLDSLFARSADPRSRLRVVVTLRADFYDRPLLYLPSASCSAGAPRWSARSPPTRCTGRSPRPASARGLELERGLVASDHAGRGRAAGHAAAAGNTP